MKVYIKNIPTYIYEENRWTTTSFNSQQEFHDFVLSLFKECGEYEFDECSLKWNEVSRNYYINKKQYTLFPEKTKDYTSFWEFEKKKCRLGVIWKHKDKTWYTPREYYMLLNFLPVTNKEKGSEETHIDVRDTQYHMGLYKILAKLDHKHAAIVKKRQMLFSYYHCAEFISVLWFEKKKTLKMFASDEGYIDDVNGSWKILNSYKNHLNSKTAWYRPMTPDTVMEWQQKEKVKINGRWLTRGNESSIVGFTLKKDPKLGVGGPCWLAWYEEGGIAPTADITLQYMNPALESGLEKSGCFTIGGSVGDLKECSPLQNFIKYPDTYEMYKVPTKFYDKSGQIRYCGLFIPTQHGMPPYIDQYGNSLVKEALKAIEEKESEWLLLPPDKYRLKKSQNPTTLEEAFAFREDLYFPTQIIQRQQDNLKIKAERRELKYKEGVLSMAKDGKVKFTPLNEISYNPPSRMEFPVTPDQRDKRGTVVILEEPPANPDYLVYFGGVDSLEKGMSSTSHSLFSCYIVRRGIRKIWYEDGMKKERYEPPKLCAFYVGRYDDDEDTNEQGELLLRLYNAFSAVERNKPNFINHMRRKGLATKHVMKRKDLTLFKDVDNTGLTNDEYGIYFGADNKAEEILNSHIKEHLTQPIDVIYKKDSNGDLTDDIVKTYRGVDFIDDYWLLEELKLWYHGLNTDRRVGYGLAVMAASCYEMSYQKTVEERPERKESKQPKPQRNLLGNSRPYSGIKRRSLI